VFQLVYLVSC